MLEPGVFLVQTLVYAGVAPAVMGMVLWLKARLQGRRGADLWQPYRDLLKLLRKQSNFPEPASWVLGMTPPLVFVAYLILGSFLLSFLLGNVIPIATPAIQIDFIFVVYVLGLTRFVSALATFDTASLFGNASVGRQFYLHVFAEPVLLVVVYTLALAGHSSRLVPFANANSFLAATTNPAFLLLILALSLVFLAESGRLPFDNPDALLEVPMIEPGARHDYSGRGLGLMEWAEALKLSLFLFLLAGLSGPWDARDTTLGGTLLALSLVVIKFMLLLVGLAVWELWQVKLRLRRLINPIMIALEVALLAVVYMVARTYLFPAGG